MYLFGISTWVILTRANFGPIGWYAGVSSLGVPILADQFTQFQPGGTDYANLITAGNPGFSDLPTALEQNLSASAWLHFQQLFYRKSNFMLFLLTASTFTGLLEPGVPGVP